MSLTAIDLRFKAVLETGAHELRFLGPTLRGGFGLALKSTVCKVPHGDCERCLLADVCAYPPLFEGRPCSSLAHLWSGPAVPQPFVLEVAPPEIWAGRPTDLLWGVRLFGRAAAWSPYVVEAFLRLGRGGVGGGRTRFDLRTVIDGFTGREVWRRGQEHLRLPSPSPLPAAAEAPRGPARWRFSTPLHLEKRHALVRRPSGVDLVVAGRRRWKLLRAFWDDAGPGTSPRAEERRFAPNDFRTLHQEFQPWHMTRFSGRQRTAIELSGIMGEVVIDGPWDEAGEWMSYVALTHLGKDTSFGLGRVAWDSL